MNTICHHFIEPLDVLFLRGNKLFGGPGSFGESLVPPWPSTLAGALRSHLLAAEHVDPARFARGDEPHAALGTPAAPGPFTLHGCTLGRRLAKGSIEALHAMPSDLALAAEGDPPAVRLLRPLAPPAGLSASAPLPMLATRAEPERSKSVGSRWLTARGFAAYLQGQVPAAEELLSPAELWALDARVGVGLQAQTRRADDGKLFSMQALALHPGVGFVAAVQGAELPDGLLRLGGDGRGARLSKAQVQAPEPDWAALAASHRARLVLTSPGLFPAGWLPIGSAAADPEQGAVFELRGVRARIVCAAIQRAQVVSGFDLARWAPKPAERAVPAGSVYWLDDLDATPQALRELCSAGLWADPPHDAQRRAEGFNRCTFGAWS